MTKRLELDLPPEWDAVKSVWDDCHGHLLRNGLTADEAYALSMAAQELLENAVKYGTFGPSKDRIRLSVDVGSLNVTVEVRSPVDPDAGRLKRLDETVQWIRGFQNPFEAYVERLKEVASQPYTAGESGLGLARIAYEGRCILDFYVNDSNVLAMSAVYQPHNATGAFRDGH